MDNSTENKQSEALNTDKQMPEIELTAELKEYASNVPVMDILYVSDENSKLSPFRGNKILNEVRKSYSSKIKFTLSSISEEMFARLDKTAISYFNVIWFDNCSNFYSVRNLIKIRNEFNDSIDSNWKTELGDSDSTDENKMKLFNAVNNTRKLKCRFIYALDEFVWDAPSGRVKDIQTAQIIEEYINVVDTVVVPTPELKVALSHFKFLLDTSDVAVIPTTVSSTMYPLLKNFVKRKTLTSLDKPSILIKGIEIPMNVQEFILENYKKMNITISSIGVLNEHLKGLIESKKITYVHHWSNPYINSKNMELTYLVERDMEFDFVLHVKPDNISGKMYELCCGDEDVLFSIAGGSIPICGIDHIGYAKQGSDLRFASGYTFGAKSTAKDIRNIINYMKIPVNWDDTYKKCRMLAEHRVSTSPHVLHLYYDVMLGKEVVFAKAAIAKEKEELESKTAKTSEINSTTETNITK